MCSSDLLEDGRETPIRVGGRVTGRIGKFSVGGLDIQTGKNDVPGSVGRNFSVLRVKRDFLRRSSAGLIMTGRSAKNPGDTRPLTYGVDGSFNFYDNIAINTYWAQTDGPKGTDVNYRGHLAYTGDRYGLQLERLLVGTRFDPAIGFVRRGDMRRSFAVFDQTRIAPQGIAYAIGSTTPAS